MVIERDRADMHVEAFDDCIVAHISVQTGESSRVRSVVDYLAKSALLEKAVASALGKRPIMNARYAGNSTVYRHDIHVAKLYLQKTEGSSPRR